jgi:hypothetical protein
MESFLTYGKTFKRCFKPDLAAHKKLSNNFFWQSGAFGAKTAVLT